ncbi:MAG: PP2C family protein-serine/threonine phosphatase [Phycisphaerae bacterium]
MTRNRPARTLPPQAFRRPPAVELEQLLYRPGIHVALFGHPSHADMPVLKDLLAGASWCRPLTISADLPEDPALLRQYGAVILVEHPPHHVQVAPGQTVPLEQLLTTLRQQRVGAAVITQRRDIQPPPDGGVVFLAPDDAPELLRGVCTTLAQLRPVVRQLDIELASLEDLGRQLAHQFEEINQELRLAARLQHDFLPRQLPELPGFQFASLFRPCSWVSGDIFDVFPLDDHHVGLYVADAVGHGVASGLLTMFITNAIQTTRATAPAGDIVSPARVLHRLNDALAAQALPDSQFVTCWYGVIDTRNRVLCYASGGHPPALLLDPDGAATELATDGCLLGVFPNQTFTDREQPLLPGQRLVVYSDGLEQLLLELPTRENAPRVLTPPVAELRSLSAAALADRIREMLDTQPGGLSRADDVTLVVADILDSAS